MATRPSQNDATPPKPTRLEDAEKPGDDKLSAAAGGEARTGEVIAPSISAAERESAEARLKKKESGATGIRLVNMTMGNVSIYVPSGAGVARVTIPPFGLSPVLDRDYAKRQNRRRSNRRYESQHQTFADEPKPRPAGQGPEKFTDPGSGVEFGTDSFAPTDGRKNPGGNPYRHSVRQAQLFVSMLRTPEAVRRYTKRFDNRAEVLAYANQVLAARQAEELKALGANDGADDRMV